MANPVIYQRDTATGSFGNPDNFKPAASAKIEFVRIMRDCPHNADLQAGGQARGLIYDFDVLIDGERRAQFKREYTGKGYWLHDADGRAIGAHEWRKHLGFEVGKKADFEVTVQRFLDAGLIPTVARMAELREEAAAARAIKRAEVVERYRVARIKAAGVQLYDALKAALVDLEAYTVHSSTIADVRAAIAEAEKTYPEDAEQIDYETDYR